MMSTRRTLLVFGALLAVGVLLAPQAAFAQEPPTAVTVTVDGNTLKVSWTASTSNVAGYEITWKEGNLTSPGNFPGNPAASVLGKVGPTVLKFDIKNLKAETQYGVAVRSVGNGIDRSAWVPAETAPTTGTVPAKLPAPTGLNAKASEESGSVDLGWNAVDGATGYKVQWRTASQDYGVAKQEQAVKPPATGDPSTTVEDLEVGMEYMFRVMATDAGGDGDPSREIKWTVKAVDGYGVQPTITYVVPKGRDTVAVGWKYDETAKGASTSIRFDVGWTDAAGTVFSTTLAPQTIRAAGGGRAARSYVVEGLKVDQGYLIAVRAVHARANGTEVPATVADWQYGTAAVGGPRAMTPEKAKVPQNVNVAAGDGELMVTWDAVDSVGDCKGAKPTSKSCGYRVEWRAAHQGYDNPDRQMDLKGHLLATSYTIPDLMNGTEYSVIVKSFNESSSTLSGSSVEARQTPMVPTPALPVFGALVLGAGLVAAGRRRLRAQRQRLLKA